MAGENTHIDLKVDFEDTRKGWQELVKDIVAFANSGGGEIRVGYTETSTPGVDRTLIKVLDGARVSGKVHKYVNPAKVKVGHSIDELPDGRVGITLHVGSVRYPLVMCKDGQYDNKKSVVFRKGDVLFRHGAKSERASYSDLVQVIDRQAEAIRDFLAEQFKSLARVPEGSVVTYLTPSGDALQDPGFYIDLVRAQRQRERSHLLNSKDLLWCYLGRGSFELTPERLDLLIRSSLRRASTLFWWLAKTEDPGLVSHVLLDTLQDQDRDKSDAGWSIVEVAALMLGDSDLEKVLSELGASRYAHFREAAQGWKGRKEARTRFIERVRGITLDGASALSLPSSTLDTAGRDLAATMLKEGKPPSRSSWRLGDLGRVVFAVAKGLVSVP